MDTLYSPDSHMLAYWILSSSTQVKMASLCGTRPPSTLPHDAASVRGLPRLRLESSKKDEESHVKSQTLYGSTRTMIKPSIKRIS